MPTTASLEVLRRIRADILGGMLASGDRLKLNELASRYGTGHTPVREALRELHGERLVDFTPNCGARVKPLDEGVVSNMFDVRIALDGLLARRAAEHIDGDQLQTLQRISLELASHALRSDYPSALASNRAFHRLIGTIARNAEATEIMERHWQIIPALWKRVGYVGDRLPQVISDHRQIMAAIVARDSDSAACLAMAHVATAKQQLISRMRQLGAITSVDV